MPRKKHKVFVYSPRSLPYSEALMRAFKVPDEVADLGFFVRFSDSGKRVKLFKRHPETASLSQQAVDGGLRYASIMGMTITRSLWFQEFLDKGLNAGFHTDLSAEEVAASFVQDKFEVVQGFEHPEEFIGDVLGGTNTPSPGAIWSIARAVVTDPERGGSASPVLKHIAERKGKMALPKRWDPLGLFLEHCGAAEAGPMAALLKRYNRPLVPSLVGPWERTMRDLGVHLPPSASKAALEALGEELGYDVPEGLRQFLEICDGFPALNLLSAHEIIDTLRAQRALDGPVDPQQFDLRDPRVRCSRFWSEGWVPIWANGGGDFYAIDLDPTSKGRSGQIIAVWHDPPSRELEAASLGDWLWQKLDMIGKGELVYDAHSDFFARS